MPRPRHVLPLAAIAMALGGFLLTLDRAPVAWADGALYASVARSLATEHPGAPSVLAESPTAVDHVRFYGPVFFELMAWSFRVLGFSLAASRIVSLVGALLVALAGLLIARALGGSMRRQLWTSALLLLTPELGFSATNGRMDSLAVGLALLALAVFTRGLARNATPLGHGMTSGALLAAAALTTPRALPFAAAFVVGGGACVWLSGEGRTRRLALFSAAVATCGALWCAWTIESHGGPALWMSYVATIVPAVGVDVALGPTAIRDWQIEFWRVPSALAAVAGACAALVGLWRTRGDESNRTHAVSFALTVTALHFAAVVLTFNLTFIYATYFAIPLLAVVVALPDSYWPVSRATLNAAFVVLLGVGLLVRGAKYGGVALTWGARDPETIERFVDDHVPDSSDVMGEASLFYYAVEEAGSRMVWAGHDDYADWTPWAPRDARTPRRVGERGSNDANGPRRRFFLWPADEDAYAPPAQYACADRHLVAVFESPPTHLAWLGPFAKFTGTPGYPTSNLYELGPACQPIASR